MPATSLYERLNSLVRPWGDDDEHDYEHWVSQHWFGSLNRHITLEGMADLMCTSLCYRYRGAGEAISLAVAVLTPDEIAWLLAYTWHPGTPTSGRGTADLHTAVLCALGTPEDA